MFLTTGAYQGYARGLGLEVVFQATRIAVGNIVPSRVFVLDRALEYALPDAKDKLGDKFDHLGRDFFEKAREGYLKMADRYPQIIEVVNANGTIEEVHQQLTLSVVKFLTDTVRYN